MKRAMRGLRLFIALIEALIRQTVLQKIFESKGGVWMIKKKYRLSRRGKVVIGGIVLLIFSVIFLMNAINGETIEQRDCTALIFSLPVAFGMIFYKGDDK